MTTTCERLLGEIANFLVAVHPEMRHVRVSSRGDGGKLERRPRAAHDEAQALVERLVVYGVSRRRLDVPAVVTTAMAQRFELRVANK